MKIDLKIPSMGESISEVSIGQIFIPSGSQVKADGEILEMETDKANQSLFAPQGGKISLNVKSGDRVKIGEIIGSIDVTEKSAEAASKPLESKPSEKPPAAPEKKKEPVEDPLGHKSLRKTKETFIEEVKSGAIAPVVAAEKSLKPPVASSRGETRRPLSNVRKVIAARMVEAQKSTAMLTTFNEADLTEVIKLREIYKEPFMKKHGVKLGFMSFFVKAVVGALQAYPIFNSYLDGDDIVQRDYYDIGIAVGTERGVIVPVVRDCDHLTFAGIEQSIEQFAKQAKDKTLKPDDLRGGGFTITNGGVYGSLLSTPILNPPQCGILGMHKIEKRPIAINDQVVIRPMMYLALSYDHRLADGKDAVSFLVFIKNMLEEPSRLLLEV